MELSDTIHKQIVKHCEDGGEAMDNDNYKDAYQHYKKAWHLVPDPKTDWEASTFILAALADIYFFTSDFKALRETLQFAMHCPNAIGNAFLHLRLGQAQFELGNEEGAKDELARALMGQGKEIFEDADPKYFEFITKYMKPPEGQESW